MELLTQINPIVVDPRYDCLEGVIATLAYWNGQEYIMQFAQSWGFKYETQDKNTLIGKRIYTQTPNRKIFFEKSAGITLNTVHYSSGEEAQQDILYELEANRKVIIGIDSFWCPWSTLYQKHSMRHYVIITGFNEDEREFRCVDPMFSQINASLGMDDFNNGCNSAIFLLASSTPHQFTLNELLDATVDLLTRRDRITTAFEDMVSLSQDISQELDMKRETEGYLLMGAIPLIIKLTRLAQGRMKYADFLRYLSNNYSVDELNGIADDVYQLGNLWRVVSSMFVKLLYQKEQSNAKMKISERILRIAEEEHRVCGRLEKLSQ